MNAVFFWCRSVIPIACCAVALVSTAEAELRVGAAVVDITPVQFPVLVNGGMVSQSADRAYAALHARAVVLDDGRERIAVVVADSCMIGRDVLDDVRHLAAGRTQIRPDKMLISATHTHSGPSSMGCLGTDADAAYIPFLRERLAEVIAAAETRLEPAEAGWAVRNAAAYTALRRWVIRPDRIATDPFGNPTVRANMHAGANPDNVTGESGPEDPDLSMILFRSASGRPIALLANFSMHYFSGVKALHPDYFGMFCDGLQQRVAGNVSDDQPPFVAIMSHGCSGDIWRRDYKVPATAELQSPTIDEYTNGLLDIAFGAFQSIKCQPNADLAMAESRLPLKYRVPDRQRLEWAQRIMTELGNQLPSTVEQVYAREQILLDRMQSTEVVIQAIRIGDIAIVSTPNETYALTGLKLKLQSPLTSTMVIELANGGDGYIPPPEQHLLGGYNTWPARSAGLEVQAEPKITETALSLLELVCGRPRRTVQQSRGPAAAALAALRPAAWWRMDEMSAPHAADSSEHDHAAFYEPGVLFFLEGPRPESFCVTPDVNRAAHFAGGRLSTRLKGISDQYSVALWFWNGMPASGRETAGWMFSRDRDFGLSPSGDHLGIGGTANAPGRLIFLHGTQNNAPDLAAADLAAGMTEIPRWSWNHVVLVRAGDSVRIHLNGNPQPEIQLDSPALFPANFPEFYFGGRSDGKFNWEGRLDEIAVFDRPLTSDEIRQMAVPLSE